MGYNRIKKNLADIEAALKAGEVRCIKKEADMHVKARSAFEDLGRILRTRAEGEGEVGLFSGREKRVLDHALNLLIEMDSEFIKPYERKTAERLRRML